MLQLHVTRKLPAFMWSLASGLVTMDLWSNTSLSIGRKWGSTSTFLQILLSRDVRRFRMPPCLCATTSPRPSYRTWNGWLWIDLYTRNGSANSPVADCNARASSPWIVAYSKTGPAFQGVRRRATNLHPCPLLALLTLASLVREMHQRPLSSRFRCHQFEWPVLSFQVFHNLLTLWHEGALRSYSCYIWFCY